MIVILEIEFCQFQFVELLGAGDWGAGHSDEWG